MTRANPLPSPLVTLLLSTPLIATGANAQSLFLQPPPPYQSQTAPRPDEAPVMALEDVSLFVVIPPEPREFEKHDIIEIIINESTDFRLEQSLETEKESEMLAELRQFPSIRNLLELQLRNGDTVPIVRAAAGASRSFEGDGERESSERLNARISATVLEIKPNGNLVLEAAEIRQADGETKRLVIAGICRQDDITNDNSILSSKLANLTISLEHEGVVDDAAKKGIITRVFDALFAF